jgi:pyruvate dehydrogenase E1 component
MNENYRQPALPEGAEEGILKGIHRVREAGQAEAGSPEDEDGTGVDGPAQVRLLGSGTILREVLAAAELLENDYGIPADVYSVTSYTELRRDGLTVERHNWLHPTDEPQTAYVSEVLAGDTPIVASSDYIRELAEGIRPFIDAPYFVLGTDGYGRSDYRKALRGFFEVDRRHVVLAALTELVKKGAVEPEKLTDAIERYEIKTDEGVPWVR